MNKMPKFVMFNTRTWDVVARGDDEKELLSMYHGKNYQIARTKPLGEREEW